MVMAPVTVTRFNLIDIQGNQVVDWSVLEADFENLGNNAAHLTLGNTFQGNQLVQGNLGVTGTGRRITLPVPSATEANNALIQAEANSTLGTWVGVTAPLNAPAGQRKATLVLHGVAPTGAAVPAALSFNVDEDAHRLSIQAVNNYQDLTAPVLQLGAGGTDRITIPATGAINVAGAMALTGNLNAVAGTFTSTLGVTGAASFGSTITIAGAATFNGGITSSVALQINAPLNVTGLATFSGGITTGGGQLAVTGNTSITGTLLVTGAATLQSTLTVNGAVQFNAVSYYGGAGAYIQAYPGGYIQISQLTVTPGTTALAGVTVNGTSTHNGTTFSNGIIQLPADNAVQWGDAYHRLFSSSNNWFYFDAWQGWIWRSSSNGYPVAMQVDYAGNATHTGSLQVNANSNTGGTLSGGTVSSNGQVYTTPGGSLYLRGSDGNVHVDTGGASIWASGSIWLGNMVGAAGRGYFGNWDAGQALNIGGHVLASGYIFNRGSTSYRCWDNADFTFGVGVAGYTLVQRDGNGYIQTNYINMTANVAGGKPQYVVGMSGDNYLRYWPANAIGPPNYVWSGHATCQGNSGSIQSGHFTLPWNGYYIGYASTAGGEYSPCWQLACNLHVGGNSYYENYGTGGKPGHPQYDTSYVRVMMNATFYGPGTDCFFEAICTDGTLSECWVWFIPTADYPGGS